MGELDEKLNTLLGDPDSMARIMALAQQLSGTMAAEPPSPPPTAPPQQAVESTDPLQGFDPALLAKLLPIARELTRQDSASMQLLYALRPFLKEEKQGKVERAAKLARLIHIGKQFLTEGGGLPV